MPFQSEKQRRYLWANEPEIARDWTDTYGSRIEKNDGGIMNPRLVPHTGADLLVRNTTSGERPRYQPPGKHGQGQKSSNTGGNAPPGRDPHGPHKTASHYTAPDTRHPSEKYGTTHPPKQKLEILKGTGEKDTKDVVDVTKRIDDRKLTFREKIYLSGLKRNKVEAMRQLNLMPPGMAGLWGKLISGVTGKVPEWAEDLTEAELMQIATSGPYLSQQKTKGDASKFGRGKDLLGRVTEGQDLLNKGNLTQSDWDRLFPSNITPSRDGRPIYPYPRDVHPGTGVTEVAEVVEDTPSAFQESLTGTADTPDYYVGDNPLASNIAWGKQMGVDPRTMGLTSFAADGGRIGRAYGGIMDTATGRRAYGLGSIFKSIKKAASKVLKSPIGKAALIGAAGYFGPLAFGAKTAGFGQWANVIPKEGWMANLLRKKGVGWTPENPVWGKLSPWKLGIAAATALPWLMPGPDEEDEGDKGADYDLLRNKYASELMNIKRGVHAGSLNPNQWSYLPSNYTYTGAKDGGRIGLQDGGDPLLVDEYKKYVFEMEEMGLTPMTFEEFKAQARAGMYAGGQSVPSDYTMEDAMMTTTQDKLGGITDVMKQADLNRQGSVGQYYAADGGRIGYLAGGPLIKKGIGEIIKKFKRPIYSFDDETKMIMDLTDTGKYTEKELMQLDGDQLVEIYVREGFTPPKAIPNVEETINLKNITPKIKKASGGRIGYDAGGQTGHPPITTGQVPQVPPQMPAPQVPQTPMPAPQPNRMAMNPMMNSPMMNRPMMNPMGGRVMAQEGGLMDLGGMEKDYRNDGGFVPIGGEEKADDVPARLSRNEFVFTADAVRGAGGGDIDKGAEIMENVMKNLEEGGQISEETQGLSGAQEMFGVSERLSEVV
jgi:hypothetical protein